jgi:gamma-glutamylcyclotransferase
MKATTLLYFAYGSNMLEQRLRNRVPSATRIMVGTIKGYELRWHKVSKDGSGKCDIVRSLDPKSKVIGVIFEILLSEKSLLDRAEGLGAGYNETQFEIETSQGALNAWLYYAESTSTSVLPYSWYKAIVIAGAKAASLPEDYIRGLEEVKAIDDPDQNRAKENFALANSSKIS